MPPKSAVARASALAVAVACTTLAAPAIAGAPKYSGTSDQNRPVGFKVKKGKVVNFEGGINMFCIGEGIEFNAVIPPGAMKITDRKFSYEGRDKTDSTNIELNGKLTRKGAKGKMSMTDSRYDAYNQTFSSCSGTAKWTAEKK
jgi:hypothetical protein